MSYSNYPAGFSWPEGLDPRDIVTDCAACGDANGPFIRVGSMLLCEPCCMLAQLEADIATLKADIEKLLGRKDQQR